MGFRFRLESVLKLRESAKTDRQQELAQAFEADQMLNKQREELLQQLAETEVEIREAQQSNINVDALIGMRRFQTDVKMSLRQLDIQQDQLAQEIERRQIRLAEANQEVQIMEKLKENQRLEYQAKLLAQEQMELDEFRPRKRNSY